MYLLSFDCFQHTAGVRLAVDILAMSSQAALPLSPAYSSIGGLSVVRTNFEGKILRTDWLIHSLISFSAAGLSTSTGLSDGYGAVWLGFV